MAILILEQFYNAKKKKDQKNNAKAMIAFAKKNLLFYIRNYNFARFRNTMC
jgi:capsule polysaccharide modification protein KpsS